MEKVNLKYLGKTDFNARHGDQKLEFAPDEEKPIPRFIADLLLAEKHTERKYKKTGGIESEETTPLFEITAVEPVKPKKGEQK